MKDNRSTPVRSEPWLAGSGGVGGVCRSYFDAHPETKAGVMKAYHAYHVEHFRCDPRGHNFTSGSRESKCQWCGRSREMVRHDDLPPECQKRPASAEVPIADVILGEEQKAFALLAKAERIVPKIVEKMGMSGETLAVLHHTHGYDPETVSGVAAVPPEMIAEYHEAMMREQNRSRAAMKREIVTVRLGGGGGVLVGDDNAETQSAAASHTAASETRRE